MRKFLIFFLISIFFVFLGLKFIPLEIIPAACPVREISLTGLTARVTALKIIPEGSDAPQEFLTGFILENNKTEYAFLYFPKQKISVKAEIAKNFYERQRGLMFRNSLAENEGMLFIFADEKTLSFWMKNVKFPLDLIFISGEKKIVDIKRNFKPCLIKNCLSYVSAEPAKFVLEVNAGFADKNGIKLSDKIEFNSDSEP
jgi:uncharacterized membrane protein (UPF0127 family)